MRARQRGHSFGLSFAQYERFALESGYALLKGKTKASLTIDRIDPKRGYEIDNIRAVRLVTNSRIAYTKMPQWMKDEMVAVEAAGIQEEVDEVQRACVSEPLV